MFRIGIAQCEGSDTRYVTRNVIYNCMDQIRGHRPGIGILFAADAFDHQIMLDEVHHHFPDIELVGCCTAGELSSAAGFSDDSICLMVICSDVVEHGAGFGEQASLDPDKAATAAVRMAKEKISSREKLAIVFVDGFTSKHPDIISSLNQELAEDCGVFGGFSNVQRINYGVVDTTQFYGNKVLKDGIVVILLAGPVEFSYCLCNSWNPVGKQEVISETDGPTVTKIGDMSALDFYHYYLGSHTNPAIENPFAVYENENDFYLRVPIDYDTQTGSISFPVDMPRGAKIQITESGRDRAVEHIHEAFHSIQQASEDFKPDLALIFSCDIRKNILGTKADDEINTIQQLLSPAIPVLGFYTRGEIAPLGKDSKSIVHHCTLIALLIRVKDASADPQVKWSPNAAEPQGFSSFDDIKNEITKRVDFLERKFKRENYYRQNLELNKEINIHIFKRLNQELDRKNQELERLYKELNREKEKSEKLLLNILPKSIAEQLKQKGLVTPESHPVVTIFFADIVSFTTISQHLAPSDLVDKLNLFFTYYDSIVEKWGIEKLRTIGDSYMCACGLFESEAPHAYNTVQAALEIQDLMQQINEENKGRWKDPWALRIGINTGPLIAGVIGQKKFAYEIWGDAVNVASRMESSSAPGKINISKATYEIIKDCPEFKFEYRGKIGVKNRGELDMYFVDRETA